MLRRPTFDAPRRADYRNAPMTRSGAGSQPPRVEDEPPAELSRDLARRLTRVESRDVTYVGPDFPVFWEEARGSNVWDVDGNRYVDLTAGFGVAAPGHRHPAVVEAVREQADTLTHGMGDVHPPQVKVGLLERLSDLTMMADGRAALAASGAEAVELALKTARIYTGKPGVVAFTGAYHGLTYGALGVTDRDHFRQPFEDQLNPHVHRVPYPYPFRPAPELRNGESLTEGVLDAIEETLAEAGGEIGAVVVEPVQERGGNVVPPRGFLAALASFCDQNGLLLIADEVYTGFGRTGRRFASEHEGVIPDLLCVGKAMSSCLPISACVGRREVMDAWPASEGKARHTSAFLGNPLACAAALASLRVIQEERLAERAKNLGISWLRDLERLAERHPSVGRARGRGLALGLELVRPGDGGRTPAPELADRVVREMLSRGWILLAGGPSGNVLSLSPPLSVEPDLLDRATEELDLILGRHE